MAFYKIDLDNIRKEIQETLPKFVDCKLQMRVDNDKSDIDNDRKLLCEIILMETFFTLIGLTPGKKYSLVLKIIEEAHRQITENGM